MSSKNFLDVDESIIEKSLLIQVHTYTIIYLYIYLSFKTNTNGQCENYFFQSNEEQEFEQFVSGFLNPNSGKLVKPAPGMTLNFNYLLLLGF